MNGAPRCFALSKGLMKKILAITALLLCGPVGTSFAGSLGANLTTVQVGDLKVSGAAIVAQTWTVGTTSVAVELRLRDASAKTTVDVLAIGAPAAEFADFKDLAKMNKEAGADPRATGTMGGKPLGAPVVSTGPDVRARWQLGDGAAGEVTVALRWELPIAGQDEAPAAGARKAEFCIDAGTQKALKKADAFQRVDLQLSADMAQAATLRVLRGEMPISLCASNVKKAGPKVFEIRGRENLKDKGGLLPILFGVRL